MPETVLAFAVTSSPTSPSPAGGRRDKLTLDITQGEGQAVDLGLGGEGKRLIGQVEEATDPAHEIVDLLIREGVPQRQHRHRMPNFSEFFRGLRADGGACLSGAGKIRKAGLDRLEAAPEGIVFRIRDLGCVLSVIEPVCLRDLL